jgi:Protein of unknown function (DUF2950)
MHSLVKPQRPNHLEITEARMQSFRRIGARSAGCAVFALLLALPLSASAESGAAAEHFPTPEAAVQALVTAVESGEVAAILNVLGPDARDLVDSGDETADHNARDHFVARYREKNSLVSDGENKRVLEIGANEWPFPIPLVKEPDGWRFDATQGAEEMIDRRIGKNELSAIQVCLAYADAQREYYRRDPESDPLLHYARHIASSPGKRDGLYWKTKEGEEPSPLGPLIASARAQGYKTSGPEGPQPYHGYYYKILTAQGPHAPGGAYDYVAHGKLLGGFALVAYPAQYDSSGVMTFLINHDGAVYQKDLGPETEKLAVAMKTFDPDSSWQKVEPADD